MHAYVYLKVIVLNGINTKNADSLFLDQYCNYEGLVLSFREFYTVHVDTLKSLSTRWLNYRKRYIVLYAEQLLVTVPISPLRQGVWNSLLLVIEPVLILNFSSTG